MTTTEMIDELECQYRDAKVYVNTGKFDEGGLPIYEPVWDIDGFVDDDGETKVVLGLQIAEGQPYNYRSGGRL